MRGTLELTSIDNLAVVLRPGGSSIAGTHKGHDRHSLGQRLRVIDQEYVADRPNRLAEQFLNTVFEYYR